MSSSSLANANSPFQSEGPSFFNQNPRQLSTVLLAQEAVPATTWTLLMKLPRAEYTTIEDFWVYNRTATALDLYVAMPASGSTFDHTSGVAQDDVFPLCINIAKVFRDGLAKVALTPNQELWVYSTQACNIHFSGLKVAP